MNAESDTAGPKLEPAVFYELSVVQESAWDDEISSRNVAGGQAGFPEVVFRAVLRGAQGEEELIGRRGSAR